MAGVMRLRANVAYTDALVQAGLRPYVLPVLPPEQADAMLEGMDGLLLTGGEDVDPALYGATAHSRLGPVHRARDEFECALVLAAQRRRLPTFAICRGLQIANVALGGTLVQDLPSERPSGLNHDPDGARAARSHTVSIDAGSRLAAASGAGSISVNSLHHQAVDRPAAALHVTARSNDGVVEGAETRDDWWMLGIQWHPEELTATPESWDRALFTAFGQAVRERRRGSGAVANP